MYVQAKLGKMSRLFLWGCLGFGVRSDAQLSPIPGCAALETNTDFNKPCNGGSSGSLKGLKSICNSECYLVVDVDFKTVCLNISSSTIYF